MIKKNSFQIAGKWLKKYRKKAKLTQSDVADLVGVSRLVITRIEIGAGSDVDNFMQLLLAYHKHNIIDVQTFLDNVEFEYTQEREEYREREQFFYAGMDEL